MHILSLFLSEQTLSNSTHTPFYLSLQTHILIYMYTVTQSLSLQTLYLPFSLYTHTHTLYLFLSTYTFSISFSLYTLSFFLSTHKYSFNTMSRIVLTFWISIYLHLSASQLDESFFL